MKAYLKELIIAAAIIIAALIIGYQIQKGFDALGQYIWDAIMRKF